MTTASATETVILEVLVMGLSGSGKTTFMKTISDRATWKQTKPGGWHSSQLVVDDTLKLNLLEPPAHRSFDFLWTRELVASVDVPGYVLMFDSTTPRYFGEALSILHTIRAYHEDTPCVVVANKQDYADSWSASDIRIGLGVPRDIPVLPCIACDFDMVRDVVIELLYKIFQN